MKRTSSREAEEGAVSFVAVIPARKGSKGLPGKNMRMLAGRPLYWHAIEHAREAGATDIIISTDIEVILSGVHPQGVRVIRRPEALAGDDIPMAPVIAHALSAGNVNGDVVLLQPTSPLRQAGHILAALDLFRSNAFGLVMTVTRSDSAILKYGQLEDGRFTPLGEPGHCFANRQSLPAVFRPNGAVYVFDAQDFICRGAFDSKRIGALEMPHDLSYDIDELKDLERCEAILKRQTECNT